MGTVSNDILIVLGKILKERRVCAKGIDDALRLICNEFKFEAALVYEIDQYNTFNLKENLSDKERDLTMQFEIGEISEADWALLAKNNLVFYSLYDEDTKHDILDFFSAKNIVLSALVDDQNKTCGLLVFINYEIENINLININLEIMSIAIQFLCQYINIRIYQNKVNFAKISLESILDNTGIDIYVNDFYNHDILYVNRSMAAPYGGATSFVGKKCWEVLFPGQVGQCEFCPQKNLINDDGDPTKIYTWDYQRAFDGSWFRVFSAAFRWVDGRLAHVVSSADITDNKRNEELINYMANYDALTNLPNRRKLVKDFTMEIQSGNHGYVLFFDIDGFKGINDEYGHDSGDEFLLELGDFFTNMPMLCGNVYRNGGDEFVAIVNGQNVSKGNLIALIGFIHERFKKPWKLKKGDVFCNISVGIACYPKDGNTPEDLLKKADQAMYSVKKSGGGSSCFAENINI